MGHAMEALLHERARLRIWAIAPDRLQPPAELCAAAEHADSLLLCVPTLAHAAVLDGLVRHLAPTAAALTIAKGLDDDGRTAADILAARLAGCSPWGTLGGPMIANEIIAGRPAFAELGSGDPDLYARVRALFPSRLQLAAAANPRGVSWCGVLKNVYAPLLGVADERAWGDNARGHLVAAALAEMRELVARFAGQADAVYGDAGLADFVTTVTSPHSHHYALGRRVARGDVSDMECEGVHSLKVLAGRDLSWSGGFPVFRAALKLATDPRQAPAALERWLSEST